MTMRCGPLARALLAVLLTLSAGDPAPQHHIEIEPTARGPSAHALARPIEHFSLTAAAPVDMLAHIAWLLGVDVRVDEATARALGEVGETSLDVRGGDAAGLLRSAAGGDVIDTGEGVILRPYMATALPAKLTRIEPVPGSVAASVAVRGRVVTTDGRPLAGACVAARGRPPVRSGKDGRFECPVGHVGEPVRAWFAGREPSDWTESAAERFDVEIGVPAGRIVVRRPRADQELVVWVERVDGGEPPGLRGNDTGDVRYTGVTSGRHRLRISARGHASATCQATVRVGHTTAIDPALLESTLAARLRDEKLTLKITDEPLTSALWHVMQHAALDLSFERTLGAAGDRRVSIEGTHTLAALLTKLCDAAGARWQVDEEAWTVRIDSR